MKARVENALAQYANRGASASTRPASVSRPVTRPPDPGVVLLELERNKAEVLRISVATYSGSRFVQARAWQRVPTGELLPTPRGVTFRRHELDQVREALDRAAAVLAEGDAA